jgi:hypothetical protein
MALKKTAKISFVFSFNRIGFMRSKIYIRYFVLVIALVASLILYSYSSARVSTKESSAYSEENQKQLEFPILRSLTHIFMASGG